MSTTKVLTLIIKRQVRDSGDFQYHRHCEEHEVINLCFADDLFLFMHGDVPSVRIISRALDEFKQVSGLTPSLPKSTAYFCNVLNYVKVEILSVLPFEEGILPVRYLGVPLVSSRLMYRDCKGLIEKVQKRLNDWRNRFLSFAGRLQLLNSVVASMHVYWSSAFILPIRITQEIEQLMRGFLWSGGDVKRGQSKLAWEVVCLPKEEGGLGVKRIDSFNNALMTTHIWNIITRKETLWVRWIHTYKLRGRSFWEVPIRGSLSWSWRKLLQLRVQVRKYFWFRIGNGFRASVWYDSWDGMSPLADHITPREITRAGFQLNDTVAELIDNGRWKWPNAWTLRLNNIQVPHLSFDEDKLLWKDNNNSLQDFSVHAAWEDLRPRDNVVPWYSVVWFNQNIPKHAFILWLIFRRKLRTQDLMSQWDRNDSSALTCSLCETQSDSHKHLFFECPFSLQVWHTVKTKADMTNIADDWDAMVAGILPMARKSSVQSVIAKLVLAATTYYIWNERNARLFRQQKRTRDQLVEIIIHTIRLKLLTCRFKKTKRVERFLTAWDLPFSLIRM